MVSGDPFSDLLLLTEARSVMVGGFTAGGTWALRFPAKREVKFGVVARGGCWLRLDGEREAVRGEQGDVAILPGPRGFVVASSLTAEAADAMRLFAEKSGLLAQVGTGSECVFLSGVVELHPSRAALLTDVLPAMVLVRAASPYAAPLRWIVEQLHEEQTSTVPGARIASGQLAQLLFIQTLRAHLASSEALPAGWLRAMRDERIACALRLMHADPARPWRLAELAKAASMSRTSFALRFKSLAGVAPLTYLTDWRMQLAQRTLREDDAGIAEIAAALGYRSESAFSQAFKRVTGARPSDYRSAQRRLATARDSTEPTAAFAAS
jgi:AraC-like DNA-binding protein